MPLEESFHVKTIYSHYDKSAIAALPKAQFDGRIIVIQSVGEARRAVDYLLRAPRVGIDTETRPNFKPGGMNPVSLLQVSTSRASRNAGLHCAAARRHILAEDWPLPA